MTAQRFPLSWPVGWKRTLPAQRRRAMFSRKAWVNGAGSEPGYSMQRDLTVTEAMNRLKGELGRLGAKEVVVSSDVELTTYGEPRSGRKPPNDPGAAVYFSLKGKDRVLACDKWDRVADNIAAIAAHIDAIRRQERYGVGTLDQAFAGYDALPPPGYVHERPWREVLKQGDTIPTSVIEAELLYRTLARQRHPDQGGSHSQMAELNAAMAAARAELG